MFGNINIVEIFSSFIVMAAIIDIFGSIPIFMSMKEQNKTIKAGQACLTALGLFLAFFFAGNALLKLFGIDKESFAVAGSFVLFILAVEMILGREIIKNEGGKSGASIVPIADNSSVSSCWPSPSICLSIISPSSYRKFQEYINQP